MKVGVLFSGGKDSTYALWKAMETEQVVCLISLLSKNEASYMFHTPNITLTGLQAKAMGLPLIQQSTEGRKEEELEDLKQAIEQAKAAFEIEGVVSGAVESVYQAARIQKICDALDLWCFNPLWLKDQTELLEEMIQLGFKIIISGVFAYPFDETWLGREIDKAVIRELAHLQEQYQINPAGEGGELETTVLDAPFFKKKIELVEWEKQAAEYSGVFRIKEARLVEK